jgi:hypothetical protein
MVLHADALEGVGERQPPPVTVTTCLSVLAVRAATVAPFGRSYRVSG